MKSQAYQVELSRADYVVGLSALMGELARLDTARGRLLLARLGVTVAAMAVVTLAFPKSLPGLLAAGLMIWLGDWLVRTAFTTQSAGVSFDPAAHSRMRVEFSEEGIVEEGELRIRRWAWDAVRRVHLSPGHVILELKGWDMIVLPDRLWASAEDRAAFVDEIEARRLSGEAPSAIPPAAEARATAMLIEPMLLARIALQWRPTSSSSKAGSAPGQAWSRTPCTPASGSRCSRRRSCGGLRARRSGGSPGARLPRP